MTEKTYEILKWIVAFLIFLGLLLLLFSAVSFPLNQHQSLYYAATIFFAVAILIIVIANLVDNMIRRKLTKGEKKALLYMYQNETYYIRATSISTLFGEDVYLKLLRKGYIEPHFVKGVQEVHCALSEKGHKYVLTNKNQLQ